MRWINGLIVIFRGNTFRHGYKRLREIRAVLGHMPTLALTATCDDALMTKISNGMGVVSFEVVASVPDR